MSRAVLLAGLALLAPVFAQAASEEPQLRTAKLHPMQYYLSLPAGWNANQKWPIVVTIDGSGREWLKNAKTFAEARKQMPFIIVTPLALTNSGRVNPSKYNYSPAVFDRVGDDTAETFRFDHEGK